MLHLLNKLLINWPEGDEGALKRFDTFYVNRTNDEVHINSKKLLLCAIKPQKQNQDR